MIPYLASAAVMRLLYDCQEPIRSLPGSGLAKLWGPFELPIWGKGSWGAQEGGWGGGGKEGALLTHSQSKKWSLNQSTICRPCHEASQKHGNCLACSIQKCYDDDNIRQQDEGSVDHVLKRFKHAADH